MTSTMMEVKAPVTMQDWTAIFPDFTTLTGSCLFIKKLMAVSLSALTYLRGIFPEKAYGERYLCGLKLKLLTEDSGIEAVNKFIDLIRSCYEAVDKKYLHQLCIGIGTDITDKDSVLESYSLHFKYNDDQFSVEKKSKSVKLTEKDPTVEATFWLLKSIITLSNALGPLPKNAFLTMKLLYNDDITPEDYEPPGFEPSENEKFTYPSSAVKIELGKVSTDVHGYKMYLRTALCKEPLSQIMEESVLTDSQKSRDDIPPASKNTREVPPIDEDVQNTFNSKDDIIQDSNKFYNEADETDCPCACKQDSGMDIIACCFCGRNQHSLCYGILNPDDNTSDFYCILCINEADNRNFQQDLLYSYEGKEQEEPTKIHCE